MSFGKYTYGKYTYGKPIIHWEILNLMNVHDFLSIY